MENESTPPTKDAELPPQKRWLAAATALAILAVPAGYLLLVGTSAHLPAAIAGDPPQANSGIASAETLARTSPTVTNRINLSVAYINGGQPGSAIAVLQSVIADDKNNALAWTDLCAAHILQRNYAVAIDACNQALTIDPDFQLARNNLRWASDEQQKTLAAIRTAEKSAPAHDTAFYINQGLDDLHVGDYDQAIVAWQHAMQLDPGSAVAANNIGTAYMLKKHPEIAVDWFNKALALDPNFQLAKNNLAWAHQVQRTPAP